MGGLFEFGVWVRDSLDRMLGVLEDISILRGIAD